MTYDHTESRLHFCVVDYLRGEIRNGKNVIRVQSPFPGLIFAHLANEVKDKTELFWAIRKGILKGSPDLIMWDRINGVSTSMGIELKAPGKNQSPEQRQFQQNFTEKGGKYAVCRTVAEVRDTLKGWGLVCKNENAIEPRLSHAQLLAMQSEINRL